MRCVVGQPFAAGPWFPPDTASVSTIYIVISIRERVKHPRHLFCTICPDSPIPPQFNDWSTPARSFRSAPPAAVRRRGLVNAPSARPPASIRPARPCSTAAEPCHTRTLAAAGRLPVDAWTSIGRDPRARLPAELRLAKWLTCARRQPGAGGLGARPAHDTLPVPRCARPVATRAAARARCVTPPGGRSSLDGARAPAPAPPGADLARPGSRSDPASRPRGPTRCPDAALRTARAAPIGRRSAPERRPGAGRPWVSAPRTAESPRSARFPRPGSPAQRPRRGDQPLACSRCGSTAVQRPSAPCRCPLRAASTCMSASGQPAAAQQPAISADQRLDVPSLAGLGRPAGRGSQLCRPTDPPRDPRPAPPAPPLSSRPPLGAGAPSSARLAANLAQMGPIYVVCLKIRKWKMRGP